MLAGSRPGSGSRPARRGAGRRPGSSWEAYPIYHIEIIDYSHLVYASDDHLAGHGPVIAVIGAGASGTLAAIYLLRAVAGQQLPLRIALIDRHGRHGLG